MSKVRIPVNIEVRKFLHKKLKEYKLKKTDFALQSGILYKSVTEISNSQKLNPGLTTISRIANYFNCSIDEVLGRNTSFADGTKFNVIDSDKINENLRTYIRQVVWDKDLNPYKLGTDIGFNHIAIVQFIKDGSTQKSLSSDIVVALANYLNVSLDEMTGRVSANQVKYVGVVGVTQDKTAEIDGKINPSPDLQEIAQDIKDMKKNVETILQRLPYKENDKDKK